MTPDERRRLIAHYEEGPAVLEAAVAGLPDERLDFRPGPGEWTPREIVHHVADSEMTSAIRLRRLLAETHPVISAYDEVEFARRLFYESRPIRPSLNAVRAARETSASILRHLDEDGFRRAGTHSESGPYGVTEWLRIYAAHCHDHAGQVRRALAAFEQR